MDGSLTNRQLEVLRLMAQGLDRREASARLGCGSSTVRNHLNSIHRKLGTRNTTRAVVVALKRGLLSLSEV